MLAGFAHSLELLMLHEDCGQVVSAYHLRTFFSSLQEPGSNENEFFIVFECKYVEKADREGKLVTRRERSRFVRTNGRWLFADAGALNVVC